MFLCLVNSTVVRVRPARVFVYRVLFGERARQVKASPLDIVGAEGQLARETHPGESEGLARAVGTADGWGRAGGGPQWEGAPGQAGKEASFSVAPSLGPQARFVLNFFPRV